MLSNTAPIFSFGVISDIQYADHDDVLPKFTPKVRYYRSGISHIHNALHEYAEKNVSFVLQLGDLIDGKSKNKSESALTEVLETISKSTIPVYHTLGNHDLYNFSYAEALKRIIGSSNEKGYYSFNKLGYKFICLDCFEISLLGRDPSDNAFIRGQDYLKVNGNDDLNSPENLVGTNRRFVKYNGAVSQEQIIWLTDQLKAAADDHMKAIVFGHLSIHPNLTSPENLLWNYEQVLEVIENSSDVVLVLSGHSHQFSACMSHSGKQYVTLPGVIETSPTGKCWAIVNIFTEFLDILVYDDEEKHKIEVYF